MSLKIKQFLRDFFYTYIIGKPANRSQPVRRDPVRGVTGGINGPMTVDALLARDPDRNALVLVVDADLKDIPVWADWDQAQNTIGIAQQGGAYATLAIKIDPEHKDMLKMMKRITVVTKIGEENIVHHIPFIARGD